MNKLIIWFSLASIFLVTACSGDSQKAPASSAKPSVQITHIRHGAISDSLSLSTTTFYTSKSQISAPISGYLTKVMIQQGDQVKTGQMIFKMQTREARVLQSDTLSRLGKTNIEASTSGTITSVNYSTGDYVQKGGILAKLSNPADLYLKLFVPFEDESKINKNGKLTFRGPSGEPVSASYTKTLSQADTNSQSVIWLFKPNQSRLLPAGLTFSVNLPTTLHKNTQLLPKKAVLSNTMLDKFWVMKVARDSLAVKVPVQRGIENARKVEILSPQFGPEDKIIINGQYGLEDSTIVQIQ